MPMLRNGASLVAGIVALTGLAAGEAVAQSLSGAQVAVGLSRPVAGVEFRLPANDNLVLNRNIDARTELLFDLPQKPGPEIQPLALQAERPVRPIAEGSTVTAVEAADREVEAGPLPANYRSSSFVGWLPTLHAAAGSTLGYAGTPGLHARWSAEIDQWIAMLDQIRLPPLPGPRS